MCFFFKQKTAYEMRMSDWSSDVCSSDLAGLAHSPRLRGHATAVCVRIVEQAGTPLLREETAAMCVRIVEQADTRLLKERAPRLHVTLASQADRKSVV